ncbi:surface carbohydrate biosynthesis protein [Nisaea sp.]|uniref:surface carbohydrate biosynthesis protein n=1 Tax=Nisaea sp. TaxID=2024842 RepID=UPI003B529BA7
MKYKRLYLPIEESARELNARLPLVFRAAARGYMVIVGDQWSMVRNLNKFMPGVVFLKGSNTVQSNWAGHARDSGHRVVAIDEEVTAMADRRFVLQGVTSQFLGRLDKFFFQGPHQHRIFLDEFPEHKDRFVVTGNPRFDLLSSSMTRSFEPDVARIRGRFGRYILVNTNFGAGNTGHGSREEFVAVCERVGYAKWDDPEDRAWFEATFSFEEQNMMRFQEMVLALRDRFPGHQIILRPHPSEDHSYWHRALAGQDRVHVVFEGAATPWMLGADILIHNTCTTGTEAMVMGVPVAAFAPYTNWVESIFLSNLVTPVFRDLGQLFKAVEAAIDDRASAVSAIKEEFGDTLSDHIALGENCGATTAILSALDELDLPAFEGSLFRAGDNKLTFVKLDEYRMRKLQLSRSDVMQNMQNIARGMGISAKLHVHRVSGSIHAIYAGE